MASPSPWRGWTALLLVVPFALVLAWSQRSNGPSQAELAVAVARAEGRRVAADDIRSIDCARNPGPQGQACRWWQRDQNAWRARSGQLVASGDGWRLAQDQPPER